MLKEKIQTDLRESLKSGDSLKRVVLGSLLASVTNKEKEKRLKLSKEVKDADELESKSLLTDEEVIEVLGSEVKKRKEAKEQYEKGGRPELAKKEEDEFKILSEYLPPQLSEEEVIKIVKEAVAKLKGEAGASSEQSERGERGRKGASEAKSPPRVDMGRVMNEIMAKVKGQADGSQVSALVKKELSSSVSR